MTEIGAIDQELQASPSRFECLKCRVVQDGIKLTAELFVQVRQTPIEKIRIYASHRIRICSCMRIGDYGDFGVLIALKFCAHWTS
ncbi:hypothetical protein WK92_15580 [Burkholderia ubonensis]|nr:hypothetical protein WJ36_11750 [Burkholderia ubonensis]KVV06711.1 hypothetical protein WK77_17085 [Burkholderia ubonensis]KVV48961.1 hypothetical protein WK82_02520 [Burkholderia ubonensis]KVW21282.1 hypothetical protein WK92_15580 [Burkholderia ubonensis]KVZ37736.1 hypothetical protein WL13_20330 [Burkholderia ubonensis]